MGGVKSEHKIAIADGKSIEFMMELTYEKLDDLYDELPGGWNGVRKFKELVACLSGDARSQCQDLIAHDYPTNTNKNTAGAYDELKCHLITQLSDHTFPGDRVHILLNNRIKYMKCKKEDGRQEEPIRALARLQRI